ncbi:MAG: AAA family ATPase [Phycisphaerae bacterium]
MQTIAIINEKGGTAKTTSAVNLAAALGEMGKKVLLVDLDGQAASSRWLGVEDDPRLADALLRGGGLEPIADVAKGVDLAPGCGKLDSVAHELRPTQGGQLRRVLAEVQDGYDYALIDSPPSLANRLIGNAMLAADEALVPVETSILALDGLRILLTMLEDVRAGFGHEIRLRGVLACRYDARTRLSRLVLGELRRSLPGKVFATVIRESVKLRECPAAGESILSYAPRSKGSRDYRALARELVEGTGAVEPNAPAEQADLTEEMDLDSEEEAAVVDFRRRASEALMESRGRSTPRKKASQTQPVEMPEAQQEESAVEQSDQQPQPLEQQPVQEQPCEDDWEPPIPAADVTVSEPPVQADMSEPADAEDAEMEPFSGFEESPAGSDEAREDEEASEESTFETESFEGESEESTARQSEETFGFPLPTQEDVELEEMDRSSRRWRRKKHLLQVGGAAAGVAMLVGVFLMARGIVGEEAARHAAADEGRAIAIVPENVNVVDQAPVEEEAVVEPEATVQETVDEESGELVDDATAVVDPQEQPVEVTDDVAAEQTDESVDESFADVDTAVDEPVNAVDSEPAEPEIRYRKPPAGMELTCVLQGPTGYQALVNDEMLREGDVLDGAEVLRITERTVEMELDGERFTLGFDEQASSSGNGTVAELVGPGNEDDE